MSTINANPSFVTLSIEALTAALEGDKRGERSALVREGEGLLEVINAQVVRQEWEHVLVLVRRDQTVRQQLRHNPLRYLLVGRKCLRTLCLPIHWLLLGFLIWCGDAPA